MTKDLIKISRKKINLNIITAYKNYGLNQLERSVEVEKLIENAMKLNPIYVVDKNGDDQKYLVICFEKLDLGSNLIEEDIEEMIKGLKQDEFNGLSPYHLGILGYRKYDYSSRLFKDTGIGDEHGNLGPSSGFMLGKLLMVIDRDKMSYQLIYNIQDLEINEYEAYRRLERLNDQIMKNLDDSNYEKTIENHKTEKLIFKQNRSKDDFLRLVEEIKEHIKKGDIFQGVLSQKFVARGEMDLKKTYLTLRKKHTSLYMNYIRFGETTILSASPETLVRTDDGKVTTFPIAGTRGIKNDGRDDQRAEELKSNIKENAEHLMLVDLGRNDLSRVCNSGSVKVKHFSTIKKLTNVMHLVSCIEGELKNKSDIFGSIDSTFPAGTLSGAPKQRAIQILRRLENEERGHYGGATIVIDSLGNLDSSINIRSIIYENGYVTVQGGAGIVYDSVPELEYKEIINKTKGIFEVIESSYKGEVKYDFSDR